VYLGGGVFRMAKALTAKGTENLKPQAGKRRFIKDALSPALYLVVHESGKKSFLMRFRTSDGSIAKITLGPLYVPEKPRHRTDGELPSELTTGVEARAHPGGHCG
jgi:hypothetical protein